MRKILCQAVGLLVFVLTICFSYQERGMVQIPCRTCRGSGLCQTCGGDSERRKTCTACYYSGRCSKCGGTRVEVVTREEATRLGY